MASQTTEMTATPPPGTAPAANGLGRAALVAGVVAIVSCWLVVGGLAGIIAVLLGIPAWLRVRRGAATNRWTAIAAVALGATSTLIAGLIVAGLWFFYANHHGDIHTYQACKQAARTAEDRSACLTRFKNALTN
jgi:hypothetical protein